MPAPNIQIAFQGGGAKFLAMLPVCHAFSQCEAEEKIQISAVAGTSAGAICAALVAAKCDFKELRSYLVANGKDHLARLVAPDAVKLSEAISKERVSLLKLYCTRAKISKVFFKGSPLLNEQEFGAFLDKILELCEDGKKNIEHLSKDLYITTTNLAKSCGITHTTGSIKTAMRDSCALPILFRSFDYLSINHHVDGGLCNNLPVECLLDDESAPIFAVFAEETLDKNPVGNIFQYILALFDASINHNTERSKDYIYDPFRIPIKTDYSTFSFSEALSVFGNNDWYNKEYTKAFDRIVDFVTNYGEMDGKNHYRFIDTKSIRDYIKSLENATKRYAEYIDIKYSGLLIRVNCAERLTKDRKNYRRAPDNITRKVMFEVTDDKFRYYRSTVSMDEGGRPVPTVWRAKNLTKDIEVPIRVLSLDTRVGPKRTHVSCIVEFLDPEVHVSATDKVEITDTYCHKDGMLKLNLGQPDEINAENIHGRTLEVVEAILSYPKRLGNLDVEFDPEGSNVDKDTVKKLAKKEIYDQIEIGMSAQHIPSDGRFRFVIVHK